MFVVWEVCGAQLRYETGLCSCEVRYVFVEALDG